MNTHEVYNQVDDFHDVNLYAIDRPLREWIEPMRDTSMWAEIHELGITLGKKEWIQKGFLVNQHLPVFHSHDRVGRRTNSVAFHPSYHELFDLAVGHGIHALPYQDRGHGSQLARMAKFYLFSQNEAGVGCPLSMTFSSVPALRNHFAHVQEWLPLIVSNVYDGENKPYFDKKGLTIGMAMTEKQGGSDVRANTSRATPAGKDQGNGAQYLLKGHKWFCSAPMCDAFLVLAHTREGLSCFLMPRWKPDGSLNNFYIQRLKDKLGNRSNASSEIEFDEALAWMVGESGRGISTIIDMVGMTRYDCMIGSTALMRRAVSEAMHYVQKRKVFGEILLHQPLMRQVIADICIEQEAALALTCRVSMALEDSDNHEEQALMRLLIPIGKYWITKRSSGVIVEAMECLGGNGYVEQSFFPRLYREAPVNAIWEGSGNVQCMDVIRVIQKSPDSLEIFWKELQQSAGRNNDFDHHLDRLREDFKRFPINEVNARYYTERLAVQFQASQLIKRSPDFMADAFCAARLNDHSLMYGAQVSSRYTDAIIDRFLFES